jgi:hypothetical protein
MLPDADVSTRGFLIVLLPRNRAAVAELDEYVAALVDDEARAAEEADDEAVGLEHAVEIADDPVRIGDEMVSSSS